MIRSAGIAAVVVAATVLTACGGGQPAKSGEAPSPVTDSASAGQGGTVVAPGTGGAGADPAGRGSGGDGAGGGSAAPVTAGGGACVDLSSPAVAKAVAGLPRFRGIGYRATRGTDAKLGSCPSLLWVHADLEGGTGSSPEWDLFFDRKGYLGTATDRYTSFTGFFGSTDTSVALQYRWLNPGDATAGPSGGPVIVTYTLSGRTVTPDKAVPPQVFDGGATTTTTSTSAAPTTVPPAPVSHCSEATPETLRTNAEMNWGAEIAKPFTVDAIVCVDEWATARIPAREAYAQNTRLLFRYTGGGWSGVAFGSGFSCTDKGVPAATAARLGC
ncbi:LppP/LprE family lipoprotein [Tsukamurella spumae]|uniref:LppP/LprE family lipoprotein n=1 Tax=Tsukamurella spumae TaxID=44753 RepID=A0A846X4E6_9ACTN|nr:LppP/LprE family lipoprotein [Tsukamurella spumae]NKY19396.1 LppP/LprE family lipoprotein [Tsukamurella spumae]